MSQATALDRIEQAEYRRELSAHLETASRLAVLFGAKDGDDIWKIIFDGIGALERDAVRYRCLRENMTVSDRMVGYCVRDFVFETSCDKASLDEAVDAVIAGNDRK
ncbi:MAG: hypothetical protein ACYC2K_07365 [Gemmatimonadales bacterium]